MDNFGQKEEVVQYNRTNFCRENHLLKHHRHLRLHSSFTNKKGLILVEPSRASYLSH